MMNDFTLVAETDKYTVVGSYEPEKKNSLLYESEAALEKRFIAILEGQGYEYLDIKTEKDLIDNLRVQLERLNRVTFTDKEWDRFFKEKLANEQEHIVEKTAKIQEDFVQVMDRDDGTFKNLKLIDKTNIHNNFLQVINQYEAPDGAHNCRYDVTVLVNGLPLVHIELKRRGVAIKEAFNQIRRYGRDSFWAGTGLFEYVQLFVISNGTHTKYYSNTTRLNYLNEVQRETARRGGNARRMTSNSFEFTSWWADAANRTIADLVDFAKTFFSKHVLLNILTRYCVFDTDRKLLVMRPYQIAATERILSRIFVAGNQKWMGSTRAGGYIWHTTGSGKTLTSFKTAILASHMEGIDKVLFVVDRSDLDYQTIKEYDRFEKGAANSNTRRRFWNRSWTIRMRGSSLRRFRSSACWSRAISRTASMPSGASSSSTSATAVSSASCTRRSPRPSETITSSGSRGRRSSRSTRGRAAICFCGRLPRRSGISFTPIRLSMRFGTGMCCRSGLRPSTR